MKQNHIDIQNMNFYNDSPFVYRPRKTKTVNIGGLCMGGEYPIRIQSMTNVSTLDTDKCVQQIIDLYNAGAEYVRLAVPSIKDANNLPNIRKKLTERHCRVPLIADVHFNAKVAEIAAHYVEKVRINPGNYIDKKTEKLYASYDTTHLFIEQVSERLHPLLRICKQNGTAIRIGINHGSLSQRIIHLYGNTPLGMAMSAMEFVGICNDFDFHNLVLSMKASNPKIMLQAVRLLVVLLDEKAWNYPIHIGLTEAGDGEYGRIKSAVGILPLLADGIGDTIRVSLTESPVNEIPFAKILADRKLQSTELSDKLSRKINYNPYIYTKRTTFPIDKSSNATIVVSAHTDLLTEDMEEQKLLNYKTVKYKDEFDVKPSDIVVFEVNQSDELFFFRQYVNQMIEKDYHNPIIWKFISDETDWESYYATISGDIGSMAVDGFVDGIWLVNRAFSNEKLYQLSLYILQACGLRHSQAEYIACPSCGRTNYNIEEVLKKIKEKTIHLSNLKIGVMGCIVNGPGEMADADYGFVGSGKGRISLYKGQELILSNIDENEAIDKLIELIRQNGDWIEK
ncbi:MAG: (E)-4-hydroxy-3-methylbut-2-enyl-diphosphate synthase [Bacteroidales bacterium]|jgi:(E)-4-hydroxy-3-methylbut-2-enyl-diphosphate synthase|nr:(E)-4-hydroxy-3-methylbut-2-enyl-diphosphate synthase [Bacteroidales bacterium]